MWRGLACKAGGACAAAAAASHLAGGLARGAIAPALRHRGVGGVSREHRGGEEGGSERVGRTPTPPAPSTAHLLPAAAATEQAAARKGAGARHTAGRRSSCWQHSPAALGEATARRAAP